MGTYRAPDIIKNSQGLLERNKATSDFNASLNKEFDELRKEQVANAKASNQQEQARIKRKFKSINKLNKELKDSGLLSGASSSSTKDVVRKIREKYYACAGEKVPTEKCADDMAYYLTLPDEIANGFGAQTALSEQYEGIVSTNAGDPNSLDIDRTNPNNLAFGIEFHENQGKNVSCQWDEENNQIYWKIADTKYTEEQILAMDDEEKKELGIPADYEKGEFTKVGAQIFNNALIASQTNPNNKTPFFPTHGDPKKVTNIMHNGDKKENVLGIGEGLDKDAMTLTKTVNGVETILTTKKDINTELRERLSAYDFEGTLNSSGAIDLYGSAIKKNIERLDELKSKDFESLTTTDKRLLETWYGSNWEKNFKGEFDAGDENDPIAEYEANIEDGGTGSAAFGPWNASDPNLKNNPHLALQRGIVSNGLIIDYENEYLYEEEESKVDNDQDAAGLQEEESTDSANLIEEEEAAGGVEEEVVDEVVVDENYVYPGVSGSDENGLVNTNMKPYVAGTQITVSMVDNQGKPSDIKLTPKSNMIVLKGDKDDAIRTALNFEGLMGSADGKGLSDYGFTSSPDAKYKTGPKKGEFTNGALVRQAFDKEVQKLKDDGMTPAEAKSQAAINVYKTTVMKQASKEIGMDLSTLNDKTGVMLTDWEFNTGRDVGQLAVHAFITGDEERSKKHPDITAAINGNDDETKVWDKEYGKEETAKAYLLRLLEDDKNDLCFGGNCPEATRITEEMITNSKHAIMGDEDTRSDKQIAAYKAGHQYRINMYK